MESARIVKQDSEFGEGASADPFHHHEAMAMHPDGTPDDGVDPEDGARVLPGEGEDGASGTPSGGKSQGSEDAGTRTGRAANPAQAPRLRFTQRQLQKKFKHADQFGVGGDYSRENAERFEKSITDFVADPNTLHINGTYHRDPTVINVNPSTGQVVLQSPDGEFVSGWKLSPEQLQNVLQRGSL